MKNKNFDFAHKGIQTLGVVALSLLGIATQNGNDFEIAKNLELFSNVYKEVHTYYVDELDPDKVIKVGMDAMLKSLDPYTIYIAPEDVSQFQSSITGRYAGIGTSLLTYKEQHIFTDVYENSPAYKSGLRIGDVLIAVNAQSVKTKNIKDITQIVRGVPNSEVILEVSRLGEAKTLKINIKREEILTANVPCAKILDNKIAYIVLNAFSENAGRNVANALKELRQKQKIEAIVLDLRGNAGGLLNEAVNVANVFLPKNELIVYTKGRTAESTERYNSLNAPIDTETPLVVLIDHNSASAAEIVAGTLQDYDRALIVGERSFGKGLVQNTRELAYNAKLKLTTSRYHIPSGRCIQANSYKDGKTVQIADSLRSKFKTKAGRTVLDGGGISPDVQTNTEEFRQLSDNLNAQMMVFNFVSEYVQKNKTTPTTDFKISNDEVNDFINYTKQKGFIFNSETDKLIIELEEKAKTENLQELLQPEINKLKFLIADKKMEAFQTYKPQLSHLLQKEILRRYYFERGALEMGFKTDMTLQKGLELLKNPTQYKQYLSN
jgi:carboxyl-terminal processing protease